MTATGVQRETAGAAAPALPRAQRGRYWLAAAGVLAAAVIAVCANLLVARFYQRWDWTSRGLYTLSPATLETLHGLDRPVRVVVFLSKNDPLALSVRHMLEAYAAETTQLLTRFVDPDRNPAEFLALQQQYGIVSGKTVDGRVLTDASIVVAVDQRHWYITSDELVVFDDREGRARPRLEQALTGAIRNALQRRKATICFTTGHQELRIDSGGPNGLAELRHRLEKNNYEVTAVELAPTQRPPSLRHCAVVAVVGPERAFSERASRHLRAYLQAGGSLLLLVDPILSEDERIEPTGLDPVVRLGGIEFGNDFIVERRPSLRLATGLGEVYLATPREHSTTRGLVRGADIVLRPVCSASQSLRRGEASRAEVLMVTSDQAFSVRDLRPLTHAAHAPQPRASDRRGPFDVALAAELGKRGQTNAERGSRLVVVGTSNLAWTRNWQDPAALGNRLFVESAVSWLAARPLLVSVPDKATHEVGLALTEDSLSEVMRYVLLYLPGSAAALGLLVMLRRRSSERRSRRLSGGPDQKSGFSSDGRKPSENEPSAARGE